MTRAELIREAEELRLAEDKIYKPSGKPRRREILIGYIEKKYDRYQAARESQKCA